MLRAPTTFRTHERNHSLKRLWLLPVALLAALYACGQPKVRHVKLAPETEIVLLYHSDTKSEIEECG